MNTFSPTAPHNTPSHVQPPNNILFGLFWTFQSVVLVAAAVGYYWLLPHPWWQLGASVWVAQSYMLLLWALSIRKRSPEFSILLGILSFLLLGGLSCCFSIPAGLLWRSQITLVKNNQHNQIDKFSLSLCDFGMLMFSVVLLFGYIQGADQFISGRVLLQEMLHFSPDPRFRRHSFSEDMELGYYASVAAFLLLIFIPFGAGWACFDSSDTMRRILYLKWGIAIPVSIFFLLPSSRASLFLFSETFLLSYTGIFLVSFLLLRLMGYRLSGTEKPSVLLPGPPPDLSILNVVESNTDKSSEE